MKYSGDFIVSWVFMIVMINIPLLIMSYFNKDLVWGLVAFNLIVFSVTLFKIKKEGGGE